MGNHLREGSNKVGDGWSSAFLSLYFSLDIDTEENLAQHMRECYCKAVEGEMEVLYATQSIVQVALHFFRMRTKRNLHVSFAYLHWRCLCTDHVLTCVRPRRCQTPLFSCQMLGVCQGLCPTTFVCQPWRVAEEIQRNGQCNCGTETSRVRFLTVFRWLFHSDPRWSR